MVLTTIVPAALVLGTVVTLGLQRNYDLTLESERESIQDGATTVASNIDALNREGLLAAEMIVSAQRAGLFGQRELSVRALRAALESNPGITGVSIAYEPNADGNDVAALPANGAEKAGRFLPYWYRDWRSNDRIAYKTNTGMEDSLYYLGPKENWERRRDARAMMTEPYDFDGKAMVEHACAIIIDGKFQGAITADRALSDLQVEIDALSADLHLDIYIVSAKSKLVVASNGTQRTFVSNPESWRTKAIDETPQGANLNRRHQKPSLGLH